MTSPLIPFHRPSITTPERDAVIRVLDSGWLTTGERAMAFEEVVASTVGTRHAVAVNSATAALHLALEALHIGSKDEVVVPTYTFAACGEVVRYVGATPRLADVDARTLNLTVETLEAQLTPATRAIIVVHFGGLMADIEGIQAFATERGLAVIEDAEEQHPSQFRNVLERTGAVGAAQDERTPLHSPDAIRPTRGWPRKSSVSRG